MRKIYWFIQQLEFLGGTETATISICNELINYYDITLVVTARSILNPPYNIDKRIKIIYLENECFSRVDEKILKFCKEKHFFKAFLLSLKNFNFGLFTKYKYRKSIKKITNKNDILIASSLDNYLIIPKNRIYLYHYHYNSKFYFSKSESYFRALYHKPLKYIFLSKTIYKDITSKVKNIKDKSLYIENMIKIDPFLNIDTFNNNLVFIGRYADQKNPMFLLKVALYLKNKNFNFHLDFYGDGKLKEEMIKFINDNNLNDVVSIKEEVKDIKKVLANKDLLLLSSIYEGMPLVINEANSQSVPVVSTYFGDSTLDAIDKDNGIVINNFDIKEYSETLINLLNDKNKLINLRKSSYEHSLIYSKKNILKKWLDLLDNI